MLPYVLAIATVALAAATALLWRRAWAHASAARLIERAALAPTFDPRTDEPLLLTEEWRPKASYRLRWGLATIAMIAPAGVFLFRGPTAEAVMWVATIMTLAAILLVAERLKWANAAWLAAGGATAWALITLRFAPPDPNGASVPLFMLALAATGFWHMRKALAPGLALAIGMAASAAIYSVALGAATPSGAIVAIVVAAFAIAGAIWRKYEPALVAAWLIACAGLFILSGQRGAETWLTPAAILTAVLFLAIEALILPRRGRAGLVPAATGAIAAPFAIGVLSGLDVGPTGTAFQAGAYLAVAGVQAGVLALAARRAGGLRALGLAIAPPGLALAACLIAGLSVLGPVWAASALAACTIGFALTDMHARHSLWNAAALICACAALVHAARAAALLFGATGLTALALILAGLVGPALLFAFAARLFEPRAPWTSASLEAAALASGWVALIACVRVIATQGAMGDVFVGFAEAGAHGALWLACAAALWLRERSGAFFVRRGAAAVLIAFAALVFLFWSIGPLNPWWGRTPTSASGIPILNLLGLGFAAPACGFAALSWIARQRSWRLTHVVSAVFAALAGGLWLALEIRRAFHGADLSAGAVSAPENFALSIALLAAALALFPLRERADAMERALAAALAGAILVKAALIDIHQPTDDFRAASFVLMALAGAALALPRLERGPSGPQLTMNVNAVRA